MKNNIKIILWFLVLILSAEIGFSEKILNPLVLKIKDQQNSALSISLDDIVTVGISERLGDIRIEIRLIKKYYSTLEKITKENIGKVIVIKVNGEDILSGRIYEPLKGGLISFVFQSRERANEVIKKIGRGPDYHKQLSEDEVIASRSLKEPLDNPWAKKAVDALTTYNDKDKAIKFIRKAIKENYREPLYHEILSNIYYEQGRINLALEELLIAEELISNRNPKHFAGIYFSLAKIYSELKDYEKAIASIIKITHANNRNLLAHLKLANLYEQTSQTELALREYFILSQSEQKYFRAKGVESLKRLQDAP